MSRGFWWAMLAGCVADFTVGMVAAHIVGLRAALVLLLSISAGVVAMLVAAWVYDRVRRGRVYEADEPIERIQQTRRRPPDFITGPPPD